MESCTNKFNLLTMNEFPTPAIHPPPWIELPLDVTANILKRLGTVEILQSAEKVCSTWWKLCHDSSMWQVIKIVNDVWFDEENDVWFDEEMHIMMCRRAVNRSQGKLIDITIDDFGNTELLHYIADRSSELRRFTIARCWNLGRNALNDAVKKLPKLEELHLIQIHDVNIEAIGISCPMLKSFTFDQRCNYPLPAAGDDKRNEHALAIAKSMPNLCRLRLFANSLNDEGLQAILEGCPRLESLDLRKCLGVDLGGALGGRCLDQIKDLRLPSDSVDDYEYYSYDDDDGYFDDASYFNSSDYDYVISIM